MVWLSAEWPAFEMLFEVAGWQGVGLFFGYFLIKLLILHNIVALFPRKFPLFRVFFRLPFAPRGGGRWTGAEIGSLMSADVRGALATAILSRSAIALEFDQRPGPAF